MDNIIPNHPAPATQPVPCHCPKCNGIGHIGPNPIKTENPFCPDCQGRGIVMLPLDQTELCTNCNGSGHKTFLNDCPACSGTGNTVINPDAEAHLISKREYLDYKSKFQSAYEKGFEAGFKKAADAQAPNPKL